MMIQDPILGRIRVETLPLPTGLLDIQHPVYTPCGSVLFAYRTAEDLKEKDRMRIGVMEDDGSGFRIVYSGLIQQHPTANGLRLMPYADGARVFLGDYVLECTPNIKDCQKSALIPVEYPPVLMQQKEIIRHWSEIVIAPDHQHIAWTALTLNGAINFLGRLERKEDRYVVEKTNIISTLNAVVEDQNHPGMLKNKMLRGGEIKQFIQGGKWLSLAGSSGSVLPDSVIQALDSEEVQAITCLSSYEETTIFSPDETLGLVMSTRGSPQTNMSILGLIPRPYGSLLNLARYAYMYGVTAVRSFRKGNIGPVLIEIEKSKNNHRYKGIQLNDPEENWVYYSPMSWHPNGKSAIWPEGLRGSQEMRIRAVRLLDYNPRPAVPAAQTPDETPYSVSLEEGLQHLGVEEIEGRFTGEYSGFVFYKRQKNDIPNLPMGTLLRYENYSDDGKTFYNGCESVFSYNGGETIYKANVQVSGEVSGEMDLQLCFSQVGYISPAKLKFAEDENGQPKTRGFVRFGDVTLYADDLRED